MDKSEYARTLAEEVLDDIELSRLPADQLVLKASRLARLVGHDELHQWLHYELHGYRQGEEPEKYMAWTGRWIDKEKNSAWWGSLGQIEGALLASEAKLQALRLPALSGAGIVTAVNAVGANLNAAAGSISTLKGIRSRVIALMHRYVTDIHYQLEFSTRQETIFETAKLRVDALLAPIAGEVLSRIDSIYQRLASDDPEAISQALTTCRRLIDAFADQVFPPQEQPRQTDDGATILLGPEQSLNRINAFVQDHTHSTSRRARIRRRLKDLHERVNVGVHADVSAEEARFLFLDTYLLLGEILSLATPAPEGALSVDDTMAEAQGGAPSEAAEGTVPDPS